MSVDGIIFDIKKYAIHDGPGIRTTVFLKGCGLSCWWCHNPESRRPGIEMLSQNKGSWTDLTIGQVYSVDEIMREILKDEIFYDESGGGVTFSGGEPLLQPDFLIETLEKCQQAGLSTDKYVNKNQFIYQENFH